MRIGCGSDEDGDATERVEVSVIPGDNEIRMASKRGGERQVTVGDRGTWASNPAGARRERPTVWMRRARRRRAICEYDACFDLTSTTTTAESFLAISESRVISSAGLR